jgi:hypothetical protein
MILISEFGCVLYKNESDYKSNKDYYNRDRLHHFVQVDMDPFTLWIVNPYPRNMTTETFDWTAPVYAELKEAYQSLRYEKGSRAIGDDADDYTMKKIPFQMSSHRLVMDDTDAIAFKLTYGS